MASPAISWSTAAICSSQTAILDRFASTLDCVDVGFIDDEQILDRLPQASQLGRARVGGIDLNKPRMRSALNAALALALAPSGFTVGQFAAELHRLTGQTPVEYSLRQAGYDLRKLRGKGLIVKPGNRRRYQVPASGARTISALLTLRDHVIVPLIAGIRNSGTCPEPEFVSSVDRHYQAMRTGMTALFEDLGIATAA